MTLEQVLADEREDAAVLRRNGHTSDATLIERVCDRVAESAAEYLTWLSERDARLRTGRSVAYLRARFAEWERGGNAEWRGRTRYYRACVLEPRADIDGARAAGRAGSRRSA